MSARNQGMSCCIDQVPTGRLVSHMPGQHQYLEALRKERPALARQQQARGRHAGSREEDTEQALNALRAEGEWLEPTDKIPSWICQKGRSLSHGPGRSYRRSWVIRVQQAAEY